MQPDTIELQPTDISSLHEGQIIDFGSITLTDEMIIEFARQYDPMPFHIDKEVAEKSHFKGLISSGPHLFHIFYNREWVPRFKHTVYAGKGITNWWLEKPVYTQTTSFCKCHVKKIEPKRDRGYTSVHWFFEFTNEKQQLLQSLDLIVMHFIEK